MKKTKKLNLGCYDRILKGYLNTDLKKYLPEIDMALDLEKFPYPFKTDTFKEVDARCVLDHLDRRKLTRVFKEIYRICKPNAIFKIQVSFGSRYMRDIDHQGGFCFLTFMKLVGEGEREIKSSTSAGRGWHRSGRWEINTMHGIPPSRGIGKMIPNFKVQGHMGLRDCLSLYINYLTNDIYVELKAIK